MYFACIESKCNQKNNFSMFSIEFIKMFALSNCHIMRISIILNMTSNWWQFLFMQAKVLYTYLVRMRIDNSNVQHSILHCCRYQYKHSVCRTSHDATCKYTSQRCRWIFLSMLFFQHTPLVMQAIAHIHTSDDHICEDDGTIFLHLYINLYHLMDIGSYT